MLIRSFILLFVSFGLINISVAEEIGDLLNCPDVIDITDYQGPTFLSFMKRTVKPALDDFAEDGYEVADGQTLIETLDVVSPKVRRKALRAAGGEKALRRLGNALAGEVVTLHTLPDLIAGVSRKYSRYTLSTYIGLASCGGATIRFYDDNYAYNIHYGTGERDKDERTGRSFGMGPTRSADDASDAAYLTDLQEYSRTETDNLPEFMETLMKTLTNTNATNYPNVHEEGQTVLTDFLAVFTAEQDRNLMDGHVSPHWDAALLEVTLLSAFHAGQDEIKLLYKNPFDGETYFTNTVYKQQNGCDISPDGARRKRAGLVDYWQFSSNPNREHCRRSGINITKRQFRELGKVVTQHMREVNPKLLDRVSRRLTGIRKSGNVFYDLSKFLINSRTTENLGRKGYTIANAMVDFLIAVQEEAPEIEAILEERYDSL